MFLRCHARKKNVKLHRYWSVVESRRLADGPSAQRQLLYPGEINDSQQAAWRKSIEVFDEDKQQLGQAALFPDVGVRILRLSVTTSNVWAIRCYERCGFIAYGIQPEVIRVGPQYHDELMMWPRTTEAG